MATSPPIATPQPTRKPVERTFDEADAGVLPQGRLVPVETAALSPESGNLVLTFVGGPGYLPGDPCSRDYALWMARVAPYIDVVEVAIVELPSASPSAPPLESGDPRDCEADGSKYVFEVREADMPVTEVRDRAGRVFYVASATGVVEELPAGWSFQRSFEASSGPPPVNGQVYASNEVSEPPYEGPGRLVLYEVFPESSSYADGRIATASEVGFVRQDVILNAEPAELWKNASTGQLLLVWTYHGKSSVMVAYEEDFTVRELVRAAESITLCCG